MPQITKLRIHTYGKPCNPLPGELILGLWEVEDRVRVVTRDRFGGALWSLSEFSIRDGILKVRRCGGLHSNEFLGLDYEGRLPSIVST